MKFLAKNIRGVTIMETIVSLGILTVGIVASLALMVGSISFSQSSEDSIVVVNLAREGVEVVKTIRDVDGFDSVSTGARITSVDLDTGDLSLDVADSSEIENCVNCSLDIYDGRYLHNLSGEDTNYKRMVTITQESLNLKRVVSEVYWTERGREHTFKLETEITNW